MLCRRLIGGLFVVLVASGLAACRENEQDRALSFEKGVYLGQEDQKLSKDTVKDLRRRAANQGRF